MHHNCTNGKSTDYGLAVYRSSSSTIQLVSPLTKEQVSLDNGGGGNWGVESNSGSDSDDYGLQVYYSSSSTIQLVSPLTKEQVATDNGGGRNWGANNNGDINDIKTISQ